MSSCSATCGIGNTRERERERAASAMESAYPTLERELGPRGEARAPLGEIEALGRKLEELLPVRAFLRAAERAGDCDWLYLLAGVHERALIELDLGLASGAPTEDRETYVRIGFSPLGPFATLQETVLALDTETATLSESPRVGIDDRRLQGIVKGLQGALRKERIVLLDAVFLCEAVGAHGQLRWRFLFEDEEPGTPRWSSFTTGPGDEPAGQAL